MAKGRKTRTDGAETREAVLKAAGDLFSERGFDGTSLKAVSKASGVSQPLIQHHFAGKDALWKECKRRVVERFVRAQVLADPDEELDDETVRAAFRAYFRFSLENRDVVRFNLWVLLKGEVEDWGGEAEIFEKLASLTAQAQAQGLLRDDVSTFDLLMTFGGMVRMWVLHQPHFSLLTGADPDAPGRAEAYFESALRLLRPPGR